MQEAMRARLELLRREFETGEARLAELERQRTQLTETMLRISGAMQVLEEMLDEGTQGQPSLDGVGAMAAAPEGS